ncbi:RICIN domain-containing protein [Shewanella baltica]|nr:RICIN domain-containing protein [Shewanella baltica]
MVQHEYTANACQQWQVTSTSDGYYRLKSKPANGKQTSPMLSEC